MLPKILHQTASSESALGQLQASFTQECKQMHERDGWRYMFWDDSSIDAFMQQKYPGLYTAWRNMQPAIKRIDTVRYLWMHYFGGVYLDTDFECLQSLSRFAQWYSGRNATVAYFSFRLDPSMLLSSPQHPFWLWAARTIVHHRAHYSIFRTAGPAALRQLLGHWLRAQRSSLVWPKRHMATDMQTYGDASSNGSTFTERQHVILRILRLRADQALDVQRMHGMDSQVALVEDSFVIPYPNCRSIRGMCKLRHCHNATATKVAAQDRLLVHHCFDTWR